MEMSHLGLSVLDVTGCALHIVWLWVDVFFSHLLRVEASLMMAEQGTDLPGQQNGIRSHLLLYCFNEPLVFGSPLGLWPI